MNAIFAAAFDSLPNEIVWMPVGTHDLTAKTLDGSGFYAPIICDAISAKNVISSFDELKRSNHPVWLDLDHDDGAAAAWVDEFYWDPRRGIIARIKWTPRGESALRNKEFYSFSPAFSADQFGGHVAGLLRGHAAGGLVNCPAFRDAMPPLALVAAHSTEIQQLVDRHAGGIRTGLCARYSYTENFP